jgi:hypothetical protein
MAHWVHRLILRAASAAAVLLAEASPATGQLKPVAPDMIERRIVHRFDFEERKLGNFESMPMHWFRVEAPGYPNYTDIGFDNSVAASEQHSLKLQLNGGSAGVYLEPGVIPVTAGAHYVIEAKLRTHAVKHSRARVVAVFVDQHKRAIASTLAVSPLLVSNDRWSTVQLDLSDAPAAAAWIMLRLELVQSDQFRSTNLGEHELDLQDIKAAAWFDDVIVYHWPRIELHTQTPVNVIRAPDQPRITSEVRDLTGQRLTTIVRVYDRSGAKIDELVRDADLNPGGRWEWTPKLPSLGWYWAELEVVSKEGPVGMAECALAWLPEQSGRRGDDDRFMLAADDVPADERPLLVPMLDALDARGVMLGLWRADMTHSALVELGTRPEPLIQQLLQSGKHVTFSLPEVPQEMATASGSDNDQMLDMLAHGEKVHKPYLEPLLARYGHQVSSWQIGRAGQAEGFDRRDLGTLYPAVEAYFRRFVSDAEVILPWMATREVTPAAQKVGSVMMHVPTSVRPDQLLQYGQSWIAMHQKLSYHFATLPLHRFSSEDRAADLALRMVNAWATDPRRLVLDRPWTANPGDHAALMPDPLLPVWVNVTNQLAGRRIVGVLDLGEGIECRLLDGPLGGALVAWNRYSDRKQLELDLYLGEAPVAIDIYGNRQALTRSGSKQRLELGPAPVFVEGIDMKLARFRSSFRLTPEFAVSMPAVHPHKFVLTNPWSRTLTGRLRVLNLPKWDIKPRVWNFSIPAGDKLELPVDLSFPMSEIAGTKLIETRIEMDVDKHYELEMSAPLTIGLPNIDVQSVLTMDRKSDGTVDLTVTITATNHSDKDESFFAFAVAPGLARQERIISQLRVGETVLKKIRFVNVGTTLSGKTIHVGIRQSNGPAVLNHVLEVP